MDNDDGKDDEIDDDNNADNDDGSNDDRSSSFLIRECKLSGDADGKAGPLRVPDNKDCKSEN